MNLKIKKEDLFLFLLIIPYVLPTEEGLIELFGKFLGTLIDNVFLALNILSIIIIFSLFSYLLFKNKVKIQYPTIIITLLITEICLSTFIIGSTNLKGDLKVLVNLLSLFLLANIHQDDFERFLNFFCVYITASMVINSISIFLTYPNGIYGSELNRNYYLYGLDNVSFLYSFQGFSSGMICFSINKKTIPTWFWLSYTFIALSYFYCQATTAMICIILSIFFVILYKRNTILEKIKLLNYGFVLIACGFLFLIIVVFQTNVTAFGFLSKWIGKDFSTLNLRTYIWGAAFKFIPKRLWLGYGMDNDLTKNILNQILSFRQSFGHMHNVVMEYLWRGGIIGLILFLLLVLGCIKNAMKYKDELPVKLICLLFLINYLISMFEYRMSTYTFWLPVLSLYYINSMILKYKNENENKIGILTFHNSINYGAVLQAFALLKVLQKYNTDSRSLEIIDYYSPSIQERYKLFKGNILRKSFKQILKDIYSAFTLIIKKIKFSKFEYKYFNLSDKVRFNDFENYCNQHYSTIIVGSDQIWNYTLTNFDKHYFLEGLNNINKYSYAASFGIRKINNQTVFNEYKRLLDDFQSLSIRENTGLDLVKAMGLNGKLNIDPTLLFSKTDWQNILLDVKPVVKGKFIFVYAFGDPENVLMFAKQLSNKFNIPAFRSTQSFINRHGVKPLLNLSPQEWLWCICNAEYIITNSFHGVALSICLNKEFYIDMVNNNLQETHSRIESLLSLLNIKNRSIYDNNVSILDWKNINYLLDIERHKSLNYLGNIINEK